MSEEQFLRLERLIGEDAINTLHGKCVAVAGVGAVGGFAIEALARSGVGKLTILDFDTISETNINRQIIATHSTVGRLKTEVMKERILDINPNIEVRDLPLFLSDENHDVFFENADVVLDCIDSLNPKLSLLEDAYKRNIKTFSSMGAALRREPELVRTGDIMDTWGCPLARQVRAGLRRRGVSRGVECVFSPEEVVFDYIDPELDDKAERMIDKGRKRVVLGSLPTITAIFGERLAHMTLNYLLDNILHGKEAWKPKK